MAAVEIVLAIVVSIELLYILYLDGQIHELTKQVLEIINLGLRGSNLQKEITDILVNYNSALQKQVTVNDLVVNMLEKHEKVINNLTKENE